MGPADPTSMRRRVGAALERVPDRWISRLHRAHVDAQRRAGPQSVRRRALAVAAEVARLRSLPEAEFALFDHPDVRFHDADSQVTRIAYWRGGDAYEGAETRWWRRACARATHVLELGANVGYYTVHGAVANRGCRYVAVEPHPASAAALRRNLALNSIGNVEVVEAAAAGAAAPGERLTLAVPDQDRYGAPAGAFVPAGGEGVDGVAAARTIEVDVAAVPDLIDGVDLLKLDIEGHEAEVLDSVLDVLRAERPTTFLEVRRAHAPRLRAIVGELADAGYVAFAIGTTSLHLLTRDQLDAPALPRYGTRDLVLVDEGRVRGL